MSVASAPKTNRRTWLYLAAGIAAGVVYSIADTHLDAMESKTALPAALRAVHGLLDQVLPIAAGALLGVGVHYLKLRSELAAEAVRSASDLRMRLQKVERDQAAWVVAAATLHEVRNPLHTLGLLVDDIAASGEIPAAERAQLTERARAQMDRIGAHLTKLRETIATGVPDITAIDLPLVTEGVARALAPLAIQEHVDLTVAAHGKVRARADEEYVRIILENLIGNGLDVLRPLGKGRIEIEVGAEGDAAFVRVRDDGPGIEPDVERALFHPLRSTKERGLGLGLSVGRALARAMEGDLTVERHPSQGTVLRLALPVAP